MEWMQLISLILNLLFGGGLVILLTVKSTREKARFEAKNTEVDYAKNMMETQVNFIVEPLKKEIASLRRSINRLEKAIERIPECQYAENCPVKTEIQKNEEI
jgi:hypothetical protein